MPVQSRVLLSSDEPLTYLAKRDKTLAALIERLGCLKIGGVRSPSEHMITTIVGQMLSTKAGDAIIARMEDVCGGRLTARRVAAVSAESLRACGLSRRKADCIADFARFVLDNPQFLRDLEKLDDDAAMAALTARPGIGPWSAKMHLIFVLGRENLIPFEDGVFVRAYRAFYGGELTKDAIRQIARRWSPYASYASRVLYRAFAAGLAGVSAAEKTKST